MSELATNRLIEAALGALNQAGVSYGDIRIVDYQEEWIKARGQTIEALSHNASRGFGVRALVDGAWGYAASSILTPEEVARCAQQATEIARQNNNRVFPFQLDPLPPQVGQYTTPVLTSYFDVPTDQKLALLFAATEILDKDDRIVAAKATVHGIERITWLASTEGTLLQQRHLLCGGGISATAAENGIVQTRSYPKSGEGNINAAGWEFVEGLNLVEESERVREEALEMLRARPCPAGEKTIILDGAQLSLQIHESCGHPIELDRVLGEEISLAGCSFLDTDKMGQLQYGSPLVHLYADATSEGGPGTFGWDDEGVPAHSWDIVKEGVFVGYLGSRETSQRVPGTCSGALRADSWSKLPIVRMVNINLAPGEPTLEEMIADTKDGLYLSANRSWSIDDFRLNFQFGCEVGWEIKNGKLGNMVRDPVYTGITPQFWQSCDAISSERDWQMWGWRFCGKGDPMQLMHVGHGCSPTRFRNVKVGAANVG